MNVYVICGVTNQMIPHEEVIKVCSSYPTAVKIAQGIENGDAPYTNLYSRVYIKTAIFIQEDDIDG